MLLKPTFPSSPYTALTPHTPINSPPLPGLAHWTNSRDLSAGVQSRLDPCLQRTNERPTSLATRIQSAMTTQLSNKLLPYESRPVHFLPRKVGLAMAGKCPRGKWQTMLQHHKRLPTDQAGGRSAAAWLGWWCGCFTQCHMIILLGRLLQVDMIKPVSNVRTSVCPSVYKNSLWFQWNLVCR